jgi:hypothetical protein
MTDREVEALSHFLWHFGTFGCRQITAGGLSLSYEPWRRWAASFWTPWRPGGRKASTPSGCIKVATIAIHFEAYNLPWTTCVPAWCRAWGELTPACPPGPGRPVTVAQLHQALMRAVQIGPRPAPDAPLPDDLDEDLKRTGLAP